MKHSYLLLGMIFSAIVSSAQLKYSLEVPFKPIAFRGTIPQTISLSNGIALEYLEKGNSKGPTLIFLHGYSDSWHSFEIVMNMFPSAFHLIALSQRGHGNSSKPNEGYHPKDFAKDLSLFITEKKLGASIIVGHSMGGFVAQKFAVDYPELTKALVLIDTDASFVDNPGFPEFIDGIQRFEKTPGYSFAREFQLSTLAKPLDSLQLALYIDESLKLPLHVWKGVAAGMVAADFSKDLQMVEAPVLIFWGSKDAICFRADQENLVRNLKNEKLVVYEGTGHALHWEQPDWFVGDLKRFVCGLKN